ncbi:MAG: hypothetical protein IPJ19_08575 [Planctomycetes bacterium]|nr:hypothetical protein [Planctomycetota bacterium]
MNDSGSNSSSNGNEAERRLTESDRIVAAARKATAEAIRQHKLLGDPIAVWRDGKVVIVPPVEIRETPDDY